MGCIGSMLGYHVTFERESQVCWCVRVMVGKPMTLIFFESALIQSKVDVFLVVNWHCNRG